MASRHLWHQRERGALLDRCVTYPGAVHYAKEARCGVTDRLARCASSIGVIPLKGIVPGAGHLPSPPLRLWQELLWFWTVRHFAAELEALVAEVAPLR